MVTSDIIQLPAIKGIIGNWIYYQTVISFKEVLNRIDNDHSIREYPTLDDHLQRELSKRSKKIAAYLVREDARFFNCVIVGLFGGQPNWYNFDFSPTVVPNMEVSDQIINSIGILELQGNERLFSIDGQHRIDGIKQAYKANPEKFKRDELPVIIIAHTDSHVGKIRTRRLFSEINTKAVRVSGLDNLITNEDNPIDINTRKFYAEFDLFKQDKFIMLSDVANINPDAREFTTILNLQEVNKILYAKYYKHPDYRPTDKVIDTLYKKTFTFWSDAVKKIPKYHVVFVKCTKNVNDFRSKNGGSILFRPLGIKMLANGYMFWISENKTTTSFWKKFNAINDSLNGAYWKDVIWDNAAKKIKPKTSPKFLNEYVKYLLELDCDQVYLKEEYNKLKGIEDSNPKKIALPAIPK